MTLDSITHGVFIEESKNRFLCIVDINGVLQECYVPSSCRLSNFLELSGKQVLLTPIHSQNARTKYAVYAVKIGKRYIPLRLAVANEVIESNLHRRYFSFLGKRKKAFREILVEGYKCDLYIADTKTIVEVKSVLSFSDPVVFPTVYSERAIRQLDQLEDLLDGSYNVAYIIVSLNASAKSIIINKSIDAYYQAFIRCVSKGMRVKGLNIALKKEEPIIQNMLSVYWD